MNKYYIFFFLIFIFSCSEKKPSKQIVLTKTQPELYIKTTSLVILGTIQDAGSPQMGCKKKCCINLFQNPDFNRKVSSLGLIDSQNSKSYLFDATPDIVAQMKILTKCVNNNKEFVDGIFLTHAHIGHYTGLMYLGKEAVNAKSVPLYVMPRMKNFLTNNGPWDQLIAQNNVAIHEMENEKTIYLSEAIKVTPILVPHRDEYSETVGYKIKGPNKTALFIPDIDKWDKWNKNIIDEIKQVDYAFLDATFYSGQEINNRDISQIPHPFIIESMKKFKDLNKNEKGKIIFIHFNHSNPVIDIESKESQLVIKQGFRIAKFKDVFEL
ncbi:MBL fold metallo-hydrolase [uncultured Flavobacterium sp.]|uniref:MBL fold metallo-hydrolase n=1 Tax=uncultured Flavobacterium sp. TaxID=165435 RepID=UPI0030CA2BD4